MRILTCVMLVCTLILTIASGTAQAATQFSVWPAEFSYGTPSGTFNWNSAVFGFSFTQLLGPFVGLQTNLRYGSITNLGFRGTGLAGYSGSTLVADSALRVGLRTGPLSIAAFGGYGGMFFNATGPSAPDNVVLQSLGSRLGVEATVATSRGLVLRGSYALIPSLTSRADISLSAPPTGPVQWNGSGNGSEYEIALLFSPVPLTTIFAGYRAGTQSMSWSGGGTTTTTFNGWVAGVELHF